MAERAVLSIARLLGRRVAREHFEELQAANDNNVHPLEKTPSEGEDGARGEGVGAPRAPVLARSMRVRTGGPPRKSVRLFANDAAQSTLACRLFDHASNFADKCGTERADRRRRHQIIGFIDLHPVKFVQDQP
ncbi:hypothetical protein NKH41_32420 [Mesorhizobium sp. M1169]|uniref:hypothetical protein n=1 Tax=Mesorhizobium sp. M1169 TaxID=2957066 RepID=UPI00333D09D8